MSQNCSETPTFWGGVPRRQILCKASLRVGVVEITTLATVRTLEQKREIVSESLGPELTPTEVARKHGISTGQIYTWRHQLLSVRGTPLLQAPQCASVELTPPPGVTSVVAAPASSSSSATGLIEIVLPGGALVRVNAHVDGRALRRVWGPRSTSRSSKAAA